MTAAATDSTTTFDMSDFHGVGKPIEGALTVSDALEQAGLNFTVSQTKLITVARESEAVVNGNVIELTNESKYNGLVFPSMAPIVRDDTLEVISIMGSGYTPVQNIECVEAMADVLREAEKAGTNIKLFRGGVAKRCDLLFLAGRLPHDMEIDSPGGKLIVHQYLVIQWSHTGAGKVTLSFVPYSPASRCFLYPGSSQFERSVRHTKNAHARMEDAQKYLRDCYRSFSSFGRELAELAGKPMNQVAFEAFLEKTLFPTPDDTDTETQGGKRSMSMITGKRKEVASRFSRGGGQTALDGYIAVCEYNDKDTTPKQKKVGKSEDEIFPEGELKLFSSFKGTGAKAKGEALLALKGF